jgi:glycosyltransferase involved in cell wall biosynthesis
MLMAARDAGVSRFFYSSSACVYAADKQVQTDVTALREEDAYPAMPEDGYGWEKLFSERMCRHFEEDFGLTTRVARYHNVYGPQGTWDGGREKAPAAICRKVATAVLNELHEIEIWGDGEQTRSFTFIDDCVYGTERLTWSDVNEPLNIGSSELVSINQMVDIVEDIAGIQHDPARGPRAELPLGLRPGFQDPRSVSGSGPGPARRGASVAAQTPRDATICITTYQRPFGLARLLDAIAQLEVPIGWEFDIVVVDNDPAGSARATVAAANADRPDVRYVLEPARGIAQVRNRALVETQSASWVAFLDDDEWPDPSWWRRLVEVETQTGADVVIGPSEPVFETDPPEWIREGRFFERERFPTGTDIPSWRARTSGVLIRRSCFEKLGERPFDERHPLAGGEDIRFFKEIEDLGARIVWVDDAIVREFVPASRSNARWLLRRAFRIGNSRSVALLLDGATVSRRLKRTARGLVDIGIGIVLLVRARTKAERMTSVAHSALGLGLVAGAFGLRYDEYVVVHGR